MWQLLLLKGPGLQPPPVKTILLLVFPIAKPMESHIHAFGLFRLYLIGEDLSGGCRCPISSNVTGGGMTCPVFTNSSTPSSDSATDDITFLRSAQQLTRPYLLVSLPDC